MAKAKTYRVLKGIVYDPTGERHKPGAVVSLAVPWDVDGLLAVGAIVAEDTAKAEDTAAEDTAKAEKADPGPAVETEVKHGDG